MGFKESKLNLTTERIGTYWTVIIDGVEYTSKEIAVKYSINHSTVSKHVSIKTQEEFKKWLECRIELKSLGLEGTNIILFKRDGEVCWAKCIMETTGWSSSYINIQLHRWVKKEIDTDELFNPTKKNVYKKRVPKPVGQHMSMWGTLSNKKRDHNLAKIKKPSKWELEQPESDGFYSGGNGHTVASTGRVTYLRGD